MPSCPAARRFPGTPQRPDYDHTRAVRAVRAVRRREQGSSEHFSALGTIGLRAVRPGLGLPGCPAARLPGPAGRLAGAGRTHSPLAGCRCGARCVVHPGAPRSRQVRCSVRRPGKLSVAPNTASVVSMAEAWRACGSLGLVGSGPTHARMQHASVQNSTTAEERWHRADNTRNERDRSCALRHAPRAAFRAPGRFLVCICVPTLCSASSGQSGQRGPRPAQSSPQSSPPLQRTSAESSKQHQAAPSRQRPRSHRPPHAPGQGPWTAPRAWAS